MRLPCLLLLSLILLPAPSTANEGNILATGDILPTDGQLSYKGAAFVIQDDCNLVLYNNAAGFESNTHSLASNCSLTLSDRGQLLILSGRGEQVWSSPAASRKGKYVAVLGPDGNVKVYGPSIWSTKVASSSSGALEAELSGNPAVRNVLFSKQVLEEKGKLESRDYSLGVTEGCDLELVKASVGEIWASKTEGKGRNCVLTLDERGRIVLAENGKKEAVWETKAAGEKGEYVLLLEIHGQAAVYGPVVWSAAGS